MRILFIHPVPKLWKGYNGFYQGVGYISAVLKKGGHRTALLEPDRFEESVIDKGIADFSPDLIAMSITSNQKSLSERITNFVSRKYRKPVVLGGVHPTVAPDEVIKWEGAMGVCIGEGEFPMLELADALEKERDHTAVKNFWFNQDGRIIKNEIRQLVDDLDSLPFPDRELYDYQKMIDCADLGAEFMGSRGCPMLCTYCVNHTYQRLFRNKGRYLRYRSVENLLKEVNEVRSRYRNVNYLGFHDDTFTINKQWLEEFCDKYTKDVKLPFWCNGRVDTVDGRTAAMLKKAGCVCVHIGVESGNDYMRREVLKKGITKEQIINCFRLFKEASIGTSAFNMIGLPNETPGMIEESIALNRKVEPDYAFVSVFYPYPGTELYTVCRDKGWISSRKVESYLGSTSVLDQPSITKEEVAYYYRVFRSLVNYPRYDSLIRLLGKLWIWKGVTLLDLFRYVRTALKR